MLAAWYRKQKNVEVGPFSVAELAYLASQGELSKDDLVRQGRTGPWSKAATVAGVFDNREPISASPAAPITPSPVRSPGTTKLSGRPEPAGPPRRQQISKMNRVEWRTTATALAGGALLIIVLLIFFLSHRSDNPSTDHTVVASGEAPSAIEPKNQSASESNDAHRGTSSAPASDQGEPRVTAKDVDKKSSSNVTPDTPAPPLPQAQSQPNSTVPKKALDVPQAKAPDNGSPQVGVTPAVDDLTALRPQQVRSAPLPPGLRGALDGRAPAARSKLVKSEGGTAETEKAVDLGLIWLARHQHDDGHWSLDRFGETGDCDNRCGMSGVSSDAAATGLALLPFLGAGHTHQQGEYQTVVKRGVDWLVADQLENGSFRSVGTGNFYAHGFATMTLCELVAMTGDTLVKPYAQRAVTYIVDSQHQKGGWRYHPQMAGDLSVTGWQVLALRSGQLGELLVPRPTIDDVVKFLDSVQADSQGGTYGYVSHNGAERRITAVGLLCRLYTGWPREHPGIERGVAYLLEELPDARGLDIYYWYYATQVMHHVGGKPWQRWNDAMRATLVNTQNRQGHAAGSWEPQAPFDRQGGRLYMTALATCTLEVYYRHLPLFRDQAVK